MCSLCLLWITPQAIKDEHFKDSLLNSPDKLIMKLCLLEMFLCMLKFLFLKYGGGNICNMKILGIYIIK